MTDFIVLDAKDTAVLVIDLQRALFTRPNPVYQDSKMIETINGLVDRAHLHGAPILYIQHANDSLLKEGSSGWKLHPAMKPGPGDYQIRKKKGNAFLEPTFLSVIEARDIKNVVVTGLVSQGCVRATSLGGLDHGVKVFLVKGAHSNYRSDAAEVIQRVEEELESAGVQLVDPGEIAFR